MVYPSVLGGLIVTYLSVTSFPDHVRFADTGCMKAIVVILALALAGFVGWKLAKNDTTAQAKAEIAKPVAAPASPRPTAVQIFDLRTKCQKLTDDARETNGMGFVGAALTSNVTSHYNPVTNHCYAEVYTTKNFSYKFPKVPDNYISDALYDVQTGEIILYAHQEGDKHSGNDNRPNTPNVLVDYSVAIEAIRELMAQE
jgi:hypothetical protein